MRTRRGWQAMMGAREAMLRRLNVAQGADAQMHDGQLWIHPHPRQPWVPAAGRPARACDHTGNGPCDSLSARAGAERRARQSLPAQTKQEAVVPLSC